MVCHLSKTPLSSSIVKVLYKQSITFKVYRLEDGDSYLIIILNICLFLKPYDRAMYDYLIVVRISIIQNKTSSLKMYDYPEIYWGHYNLRQLEHFSLVKLFRTYNVKGNNIQYMFEICISICKCMTDQYLNIIKPHLLRICENVRRAWVRERGERDGNGSIRSKDGPSDQGRNDFVWVKSVLSSG